MTSIASGSGELSACECPVCFLLLTRDRAPMSLPCGHTLCLVCVRQLSEMGKDAKDPQTFICPLCRKMVYADAVSLNITLMNLIEELIKRGGNSKEQTLNVPFHEVQIGKSLDRGAFGEVYHGFWRDNEVAVKVFGFGQMSNHALVSFRKEVYVMNCLRHPNVVLMMGACQTPPKLAILMEFLPGGSLYKVLHVDKHSLSQECLCGIGSDVCRGLQYLHSINILHRDLKSKNVLLTSPPPNCQAKLCDFGMARVRLESATMTGNVGTVHWTAPEVLANQRYQFPADVYGLGMVLYEMVARCIPFQDLIPVAVMMAVAINKKQPDLPADCNVTLATIIKRCVTWEPSERPAVADVLGSLTDLLPKPSLSTTMDNSSGFMHSESLGVVFLGVTDTIDIGVDEVEATPLTPPQHQPLRSRDSDEEVARSLELNERDIQLERDLQLAEQLQMKENSYMTPSDLVPKTIHAPLPEELMKTAKSFVSSAKKKTSATFSMLKPSSLLHKHGVRSPPVPPPLPPPPLPPPPPPLPHENMVLRRAMMESVRKHVGYIRHNLRHVTTVEKRAFRVGRVVDGTSSEQFNYTTQNQILNFNKKYLRQVTFVEPPPPYPVGRVLPPKNGRNIKRLSSIFNLNSSRSGPMASHRKPPGRLHREQDNMMFMDAAVKQVFPTAQGVEQERIERLEQQDMREQQQATGQQQQAAEQPSGQQQQAAGQQQQTAGQQQQATGQQNFEVQPQLEEVQTRQSEGLMAVKSESLKEEEERQQGGSEAGGEAAGSAGSVAWEETGRRREVLVNPSEQQQDEEEDQQECSGFW